MDELMLAQIMELQGEIKVRLIMKLGLLSEAQDIAAELLDCIMRSPITKLEYQVAYAALP